MFLAVVILINVQVSDFRCEVVEGPREIEKIL